MIAKWLLISTISIFGIAGTGVGVGVGIKNNVIQDPKDQQPNDESNIILSQSQITLKQDQTTSILINNYEDLSGLNIKSISDNNVVSATLFGNELKITAKNTGHCVIVLTDLFADQATVEVSVQQKRWY